MATLRAAFATFLPLAVLATLLAGLVYGIAQQGLRSGANDPQLQLAEDGARALDAGGDPARVVGPGKVDVAVSLAPFVVVFDAAGRVTLFNELFAGMMGFSSQALEGRSLDGGSVGDVLDLPARRCLRRLAGPHQTGRGADQRRLGPRPPRRQPLERRGPCLAARIEMRLVAGVLEHAAVDAPNVVTWQPRAGVRVATVTARWGDGTVMAGRSLREVERREDQALLLVAVGWACTLAALAISSLVAEAIRSP